MKILSKSQFVEQKFIVNEEQIEKFLNCVSNNIEEDEHFKYTVYNIYYADVSEDLISKVFKKRSMKERIRLRSYGMPSIHDSVYIEMKEQHQDSVVKRRLEMSLEEAHELLSNQHECGDNEVDELLRNQGLIPKMFIGYERVAYCSKFNPQVRLTFTMNMRYRNEDFRLCDLPINQPLFKDETTILEIKGEILPEWLLGAIEECGLKPIKEQKVSRQFKKIVDQVQLSNNLV